MLCFSFTVRAGAQKSNPHVCVASTLHLELSQESPFIVLIAIVNNPVL